MWREGGASHEERLNRFFQGERGCEGEIRCDRLVERCGERVW